MFSAEGPTRSSWVTWDKEGNLIQLDPEIIKGLQWQSVWRRGQTWFSVLPGFAFTSSAWVFVHGMTRGGFMVQCVTAAHEEDTHTLKCVQPPPELWILLIQTLPRWCPHLVCWAKESPCRGQLVSTCAGMGRDSSWGRAESAWWSSLGSVPWNYPGCSAATWGEV